jgi:hypothetical protein
MVWSGLTPQLKLLIVNSAEVTRWNTPAHGAGGKWSTEKVELQSELRKQSLSDFLKPASGSCRKSATSAESMEHYE